MAISHQQISNGAIVISIEGRLDATTETVTKLYFKQLVQENPKARLVLDLALVDFIDSTGLGTIISGLRTAREHQGELMLCRVQAQAMRVFELTAMDRVVPIYDSLDEIDLS